MASITSRTRNDLIKLIEASYIRADVTDDIWASYLDDALVYATRAHNWRSLFSIQTYSTVASTRSLALNAQLRTLYSLGFVDTTSPNNSHPLVFMEQDRFLDEFIQEDATPTGEPEHWTFWGTTILLGPTPNDVFTIESFESRYPTSFTTGPTQSSDIPKIDDYLVSWAVYRAYKAKSQDDLAGTFRIEALDFLAQAIKADNKMFMHHRLTPPKGYEMTKME